MASTINALTTGVGGIQSTGDTSGEISLQSNGSTVLAMTASGVAVTGTMTVGGNSVLNAGSTVTVAQGGTGATSLTANNVVLGNGTSAVQFVAPGSSGNVLTSNGTTWTSAAAGGGSIQTQVFTAPGTWTKPSTVTQVRVTVVGGGGGGGRGADTSFGTAGGTSSFGPAVSATGGGGGRGSPTVNGSPGSGTVSTGTVLRTSYSDNSTHYLLSGGMGPNPSSPAVGIAFSITGTNRAGGGANGPGEGGFGGSASAIVPVSAPVAITVGSGGTGGTGTNAGAGIGGAVVVEWVG